MRRGPLNSNDDVLLKLSEGGEALNLLDSDSGEQQDGDRRVRTEAADRLV